MSFKILLDFKGMKIAELLVYVQNLISKTDKVEEYVDLQAQIDILISSYQEFVEAVDAASDGGRTLILIRNQAKQVMFKDLEKLVLLTELNANGNEAYATGAGFNLRSKGQRSTLPLEKPVLKYLRRGKKSGTLEGELVNFPKGVKEFSILYSLDGGVTKTNGTNCSGKRFVLDVGVTEQRVQVEGYFIGTFQRKSDVCEPMEIFVL